MGLTVVDAGVLIGLLDAHDPHHEAARRALEGALERGDQLVLPASALAEVAVGPSRRGAAAVDRLLDAVARIPLEVQGLGEEIALAAARLWARTGLKLPDALVIATAAVLDADHVLTTDRRWPTRSKLGIQAALEVL